jgi:hypothetical protein
LLKVDTPNVLNCNATVPFWLSWAFGHVKVGHGSIVNEQIFMQWRDPNPMSVSVVSITTGWGATGIWRFFNFEGTDDVLFVVW